MNIVPGSLLDAIGNTPMAELRKLTSPGSARVMVKLEWSNPTGSMKDRMTRAAIEGAEKSGKLLPGGTVVEYTAGTTGISLALVCAAKGYGLEIVYSDAFSVEKRQTMQAFGAQITDVRSEHGKINEALIKEMIRAAGEISSRPGHWWVDQLNNTDATRGYHAMGAEIWEQTGGEVDAFVHSVSTAHSLHGATLALWERKRGIRIVAVEPSESAVLSGHPTGSHKIEGIGIGFIPPLWEPDMVDEIQTVSTGEAMEMARRLAREEGIFAGTSTGANIAVALRVAKQLGPGKTVATIIVDSGLRYLSTDLYRA